MTRNEQRIVYIFLIVAAAGLLFLFLNRYRFYYNYVKIAFHESDKPAVTTGDDSTDIGKRNDVDGSERRIQTGETGAETERGETAVAAGLPSERTRHGAAVHGDAHGRAGGSGGPAGKIDINRAGLDELMSLPGIGRVTALNIIEYRTRKGSFTDVHELIEVQGIGPKKLDAILNYVVAEQRVNIF
jgi:competence ComEA-like helix-hairpin-helix protein